MGSNKKVVKGGGSKGGGAKRNPPKRKRAKRAPAKRAPAKRAPAKRGARRHYPMALHNPPSSAVAEVIGSGGAAVVGGLVSVAAVSVFNRLVAGDTARAVASVVLPSLVGVAATRMSGPHAQAAAAGAFGVTGVGVARLVAGGLVQSNPPPRWAFRPNPLIAPPQVVPGALQSAWASPLRGLS